MFKHWFVVPLVVLAVVAVLAGCSQDTDFLFNSYTIGTNGGTITTSDGTVKLVFPQNAVSTVTIVSLAASPETPNGLVPGTAVTISSTQGAATLSQPVQLTIKYLQQNTAGLQPNSLKLYRLQQTGDQIEWVPLADSALDTTQHTVTGSITAFGTYAVIGIPL